MTAIEYALYGKQHGPDKLRNDEYLPTGKPEGAEWTRFIDVAYPLITPVRGGTTRNWGPFIGYYTAHPEAWDEVIYRLQQQAL